jgi:hypothetical protein
MLNHFRFQNTLVKNFKTRQNHKSYCHNIKSMFGPFYYKGIDISFSKTKQKKTGKILMVTSFSFECLLVHLKTSKLAIKRCAQKKTKIIQIYVGMYRIFTPCSTTRFFPHKILSLRLYFAPMEERLKMYSAYCELLRYLRNSHFINCCGHKSFAMS